MCRLICRGLILLLFHLISSELFANDTLYISDKINSLEVNRYFSLLEDSANELDIARIVRHPEQFTFRPNDNPKLNFKYSRSTFWLRLSVVNNSAFPINALLEIANPDIDFISFYEVRNNKVTRVSHTGELIGVSSRLIYNKHFLFPVSIPSGELQTYYFSVSNNGHAYTVPVLFKERAFFEKNNGLAEMVNWLIYGLLFFILVFNLYMYWIYKEKVSLYYTFSVLLAILFLLHYEGYFYLINPPVYFEKFKWISPCLYGVFLLLFAREFVAGTRTYTVIKNMTTPLILFIIVAPFFRNLSYPFSLITEVGVPVLILIIYIFIMVMAVGSYRRDYSPSKLFLAAYFATFVGVLANLMKELDLLHANIIVLNSMKIGFILQSILLTMAVMEQFRIAQEKSKKTIKENLERIEIQNKELEIINTELEKLSIVVSETDNSIAIYDSRGRMEWGNDGFEKLYETNINELIKSGKDTIECIIPNANIQKLVDRCLETKSPVRFETAVMKKGNGQRWIQTTLSPFIRSGKIQKIIAVDADITSLKNYEKELVVAKEKAVESDRLKTAFLGNMSHEIRTPLNGIMGFSQLLSRNELNEDEVKGYVEIIKNCGEQLIHILDDILDISLIESNQLKVYPVEIELHSFMHEIREIFEHHKSTIGKHNIALKFDLRTAGRPFTVVSDPHRLKQVLSNLIKNAFKFTSEGYVKVIVRQKNQQLQFCVEDTGIGIDPEKKDYIFERFRQGEESLNRKYGGTGLGLSISKGIIEKLGGSIWLDISYKTGFKICFTIPLVHSGQEPETPKQHAATNNIAGKVRNKNILIVEDHDISYKVLRELLLPYEPVLFWVKDGKEAVDLARQNNFDLILMDINLPEMDGITATREIRKFNPSLPILVQTAYAMDSEKARIFESGCNDMLSKPINKKEFYEKLSKLL